MNELGNQETNLISGRGALCRWSVNLIYSNKNSGSTSFLRRYLIPKSCYQDVLDPWRNTGINFYLSRLNKCYSCYNPWISYGIQPGANPVFRFPGFTGCTPLQRPQNSSTRLEQKWISGEENKPYRKSCFCDPIPKASPFLTKISDMSIFKVLLIA